MFIQERFDKKFDDINLKNQTFQYRLSPKILI